MRNLRPKDSRRTCLRPQASSLRLFAGTIFLLAGVFKLGMPLLGASFGEVLATLPIPCAALVGIAVPSLEIIGGLALLRRWQIKFFAPLLAIDMVFAIALIGLPGALGRALLLRQHHGPPREIGQEFWRLPLEVGLLVVLWMMFRNEFRKGASIKPSCDL